MGLSTTTTCCDIQFPKNFLPSIIKTRFLDSLLNNQEVSHSMLQNIFFVNLTKPAATSVKYDAVFQVIYKIIVK